MKSTLSLLFDKLQKNTSTAITRQQLHTLLEHYKALCSKEASSDKDQQHKTIILSILKGVPHNVLIHYLPYLLEDKQNRRKVYEIVKEINCASTLPALLFYLPTEPERYKQLNLEIIYQIATTHHLRKDDIQDIVDTLHELDSPLAMEYLIKLEKHHHIDINHNKWNKKIGHGLYELQM